MTMRTAKMISLAFLLGACAVEDGVVEGAQLLAPVDVEFTWNEAYNELSDDRAALVPLDIMVYDGLTGEPVFAEVELRSDAALFIAPDQLVAAEPGCTTCLWDAFRDEYIEQPVDEPDSPFTLATDADGMARVYAVVDSVPQQGSDFDDVVVTVMVGEQEEAVHLVPR